MARVEVVWVPVVVELLVVVLVEVDVEVEEVELESVVLPVDVLCEVVEVEFEVELLDCSPDGVEVVDSVVGVVDSPPEATASPAEVELVARASR